MKDNRLEKEFEEYFKGVNISNDITADAKQSVGRKRKIMPKILKFASIAASIVLVFAVSLTVILKSDFLKKSDSSPSVGNSSQGSGDADPSDPGASDPSAPGSSDESPGSDSVRFELYSDSDLVKNDISAYSVSSLDKCLKFIENFAVADNASVTTCNAGYLNGKLALVTAQVSITSGLNRDETAVFVEFTAANTVYSGLEDYYDGYTYYYYGADYYLTRTTAENGEPEFKLHILYKGVKYYFNVHSSDIKAYQKYLDLIVK